MTFWQALWELILGGDGNIPSGYAGSKLLVLAVGCAIMGFIVVVLDRILYEIKGRSILNLTYGKGILESIKFLVLWGLGAGVGGFLGSAFSMFQFTRAACIGIGVGWPIILPRLIESFNKDVDQQQPEDSQNDNP